MNKKINIIFNIILLLFVALTFIAPFTNCAEPQLVKNIDNAFNQIKSWLITLATPACAIAVGVGVFMKKFSFGDEERLRIAKKLIRTALVSYVIILMIDLILEAINGLVGM